MPASFLPLVVTLLLVGVPIVLLLVNKRVALIGAVISLVVVLGVVIPPQIHGARLRSQASRGDAGSQFEYARWLENHSGRVNSVLIWPFLRPQIDEGYVWVERAAENGHAEAMYALGVRLKQGFGVPMPDDWDGPAGNVFAQPERGQVWIDRGIAAGYQPTVQEDQYYWRVFRE